MKNLSLLQLLENYDRVREELDAGLFVMALLAALGAALLAALMYRFFYERRGTGSQVHRAFPLLAISITTLFIGVQLSIPLSLGLLGALSIIRFRTPIKEPEEVGFIMLVIAASISAATFNFRFLWIMYLVACLSLVLVRGAATWKGLRRDGLLVLSLPAETTAAQRAALEDCLTAHLRRHRIESVALRDGAASYQYVFSGLKGSVPDFQADLAARLPLVALNVYLDRPGGIR